MQRLISFSEPSQLDNYKTREFFKRQELQGGLFSRFIVGIFLWHVEDGDGAFIFAEAMTCEWRAVQRA